MKKLPVPSSMNQKGCKVLPLHPNRRYHNNTGCCPLSAPLLCKKKETRRTMRQASMRHKTRDKI